MKNKKKLIILSIILVLILVVLSSASYAYFTTSGSTGTEETITSGTMALSFSDGPQINATNLAPGDYIEKTFSVTNTGTLATTYDVYLSEVVNTFVQKSDLVYEITSNDGGYNTPNQVVVPNQEAKIVDTQSIAVGATHHYTLKITYKLTNQIQNDNMGRGFTAKISINEYNLNNTEKLLKLLDTSGNLVDKQMISSGVTDYYYNLANTSLTGTTNIYCNNGGIPRIENNQLIVSGLTVDTECTMSSDIEDTIANRLLTSKTGIVMTNNQDGVGRLTLTNKDVELELNGKSITSIGINDNTSGTYNRDYELFRLKGSDLTINDSVGTGGLYTGTTARPLFMVGNSDLIVNGGTFSGRQTIRFEQGNNNYFEINGGNFTCIATSCTVFDIYNDNNQVVINGGNFTNPSGVNIIANAGSELTINDGNFNVNSGRAIINQNGGTTTINGGNFKTRTDVTIYNNTNSTMNIAGGNFEGIDNSIIYNTGTATINNGNFVSVSGNAVNNTNGNVVINDGRFDSTSAATIRNATGVVNINGGVITQNANSTANTSAILNAGSGTTNITDNNGRVYIANHSIDQNRVRTINNNSPGTINITGNKADVCNINAGSNSQGICIYGVRRTLINETQCTGNTNVDGATIVNDSTYTSPVVIYSGNMKIKNADIIGMSHGGIYYSTNENASGIEAYSVKVCSSNVTYGDSSKYDIYNSTAATIYYSSNNVFTDGTNIPKTRNTGTGSIVQSEDACTW